MLLLGILTLIPAYAEPPTSESLRQKEIAELEHQIAMLQAQLKSLKEREILPQPREVVRDVPPADWKNLLSWRCVGPATMGGRIAALAVCESDPDTYFVGTASGGLLKTSNNGVTFEHQFDKEATASIGAVAVAPSNKDIVWVGSGEANPRNSVSCGDGVYKSIDGGKTWQNMGLKKTYQIGKIVIHPKDPNVVYVGALGRLYGPNPERGLFKTTDGGKTWKNILFVDERTGVIDIAMNSTDPNTLLVAAWERERDAFDSFVGDSKAPPEGDTYSPAKGTGPGSGIYRTTDGGGKFERIEAGLPKPKKGRIGLSYSRKTPNTVFAIVDSEKSGLGPPPAATYFGVSSETAPGGVLVTGISANGPASKGGLLENDLITKFDNKEVKNYETLIEMIAEKQPGDKVKVTVTRAKESKELEVTLGSRGERQPPLLGVQIAPNEAGARVTLVSTDSAAAKAGLQIEDVITAVDGTPVTAQKPLQSFLLGKKAGDKIKISFTRDKQKKEVEATLTMGASERPYSDGQLGGQRANMQVQQGADGVDAGGVYRSTDNGATWTRINSANPRPFYFSTIRVDPNDDNVIYVLGISMLRSTDGGKSFSERNINSGVHSDQHDLWIDPKDSRHILVATDGGFYVTFDAAAHWEHLARAALGQFYHVSVDTRRPYHVAGGLQDNGSWCGPSNSLKSVGPSNEDWVYVNGGDGFVCRIDPNDPYQVYGESQDGNMMRRNLRTGASSFIRPAREQGQPALRFNWNTPFILSSHNSKVFYCAGDHVYRSVKQGDELKPISEEITLTRHGTATALAESPRNPEMIWVGSDDGAVSLTRDGGKTWREFSGKLKAAGLPGPRWVSSIEASRFVEGRAYVVFDAHRSNDDAPYIFVTEDFGVTWKAIVSNLPLEWTRVVREDLYNPDLLYLGTEFAAWASINRGGSWFKLNGEQLPTVAIHEIAQPTTANDIVLATHGRSLWIADVTMLRQMKPALFTGKEPHLFVPSAAVRWQTQPGGNGPFGESVRRYLGENPIPGASIEYVLRQKTDKVTLRVVDVLGKTLVDLKPGTEAGLNKVQWNLRRTQPVRPAGPNAPNDAELMANPSGRLILGTAIPAGTYRVVLTVDGKEFIQPLVVENDPTRPPEAATAVDEVEEARALRRQQRKAARVVED